jgi:Domain of unknown function (DUF6438)
MKVVNIVLCFVFVFAQLAGRAQTGDGGVKPLRVEKVIYHSSHCYGTCPAIDLEVDSNYDVALKLDVWGAKGETDKHLSGNFKGKIDPHTYFKLVAALVSSHYADLKFPPIFCCDGIVTTIIVYANGSCVELSSMTPPKEADKLISFLGDLALRLKLPRTTEDIEIEE